MDVDVDVRLEKAYKRIQFLEDAISQAVDFLYGSYAKAGFTDKYELARHLVAQRNYNAIKKKKRLEISHENRSVEQLLDGNR